VTVLGRLPARGELATAGTGIFLTFLATLMVQREGAELAFALMLGSAVFVAFVAGFAFVPHVFVPLALAYFALLSPLETFVFPSGFGGTKDLITFAAVVAAVGLVLRRRTIRLDAGVLLLLGLVFGLYFVNIGGALTGETGHGAPWFHGIRLFAEPLCLFVFGASVRNPHKTLRWSVVALVAVAVVNAAVGLFQQAVGVERLLSAGYDYGSEVRQFSGHLRSFGTVGEPFSYAGLLLLALAALLLWYRRSAVVTLAVAVLAVGLYISYVRTAAFIAVALLALAAARRGHGRYALLLMLAAVAGAAIVFASASQRTATRSVQLNPTTYLTLNGRTNIWTSTLNSSADWMFGRGVGATGTASQRATRGLTSSTAETRGGGSVVDSSYFAVIADVGVLGLAILIAFFARIIEKARAAAREGGRSGWLALGLLTATLLDALTRESFTGFPTAYMALLVIGVAWATWIEAEAPARE
jgi:O-antigen ligase